jgi:signal transduction histidine kinase
VARHAEATDVQVELRDAGSFLEMNVLDDGRGLPQPLLPRADSLGLLGMRERAAALGGTLTVTSTPGGGTTVTARIPAG